MRAAIFDLDGTLADTAPDLIGAASDLMAELGGAPLDAEALRAHAGRGGKALIALGLERSGRSAAQAEIDALFPRFLEIYGARIDRASALFPGAVAALERLATAGWALGVCTNKPEGLALDLLARLGVLERFQAVLGADTLPVRKPDPRHLLETVARVGGDPRRSVLIGDSQTDRDAARNAETPVILTSFGYSLAPVASLKPDAVIDDYAQLDAVLERLAPAA